MDIGQRSTRQSPGNRLCKRKTRQIFSCLSVIAVHWRTNPRLTQADWAMSIYCSGKNDRLKWRVAEPFRQQNNIFTLPLFRYCHFQILVSPAESAKSRKWRGNQQKSGIRSEDYCVLYILSTLLYIRDRHVIVIHGFKLFEIFNKFFVDIGLIAIPWVMG